MITPLFSEGFDIAAADKWYKKVFQKQSGSLSDLVIFFSLSQYIMDHDSSNGKCRAEQKIWGKSTGSQGQNDWQFMKIST